MHNKFLSAHLRQHWASVELYYVLAVLTAIQQGNDESVISLFSGCAVARRSLYSIYRGSLFSFLPNNTSIMAVCSHGVYTRIDTIFQNSTFMMVITMNLFDTIV